MNKFKYVSNVLVGTSGKVPVTFIISLRASVFSHVSARDPLEEFLWNLVLGAFIKFCREVPINSNRTKIWRILRKDVRPYIILVAVRNHYWTTVQRKTIVAFLWPHWPLLYCWQLHIRHTTIQRESVVTFLWKQGHANATQCYNIRIFVLFTHIYTSTLQVVL
jgi:hypothetical protein